MILKKSISLTDLVRNEDRHTRELQRLAYKYVFKCATIDEMRVRRKEAYDYIDSINPLRFIRKHYEGKFLTMIKLYETR